MSRFQMINVSDSHWTFKLRIGNLRFQISDSCFVTAKISGGWGRTK